MCFVFQVFPGDFGCFGVVILGAFSGFWDVSGFQLRLLAWVFWVYVAVLRNLGVLGYFGLLGFWGVFGYGDCLFG